MPLFTGKRTARMPQVMLDPEMLELIRHRAERMERKLGEEIVHLLMQGLYRDKESTCYDLLRLDAHRFACLRTASLALPKSVGLEPRTPGTRSDLNSSAEMQAGPKPTRKDSRKEGTA